jgi:NADP-dependent 3-hydroxy acid dehydrogenase YdfG
MNEGAPIAVLTGGSGGLAPGIATALMQAGFVVVLTARRAEALDAAAERLRGERRGTIAAIASDARDPASTRALAQDVLARFGRIDVLVNAAASSTPIGGAIEELDVAALIADADVKIGGYLRYIQAVVPAMKQAGRGHIVNIGGLTGRSSDTLSGLRNVAVSHLTKVLSDQLGPFSITVNAVHPGIVRTWKNSLLKWLTNAARPSRTSKPVSLPISRLAGSSRRRTWGAWSRSWRRPTMLRSRGSR